MINKLFYFGVQTLGGEGGGQEKFGQNPYFRFIFLMMTSLKQSDALKSKQINNLEYKLQQALDTLLKKNSNKQNNDESTLKDTNGTSFIFPKS